MMKTLNYKKADAPGAGELFVANMKQKPFQTASAMFKPPTSANNLGQAFKPPALPDPPTAPKPPTIPPPSLPKPPRNLMQGNSALGSRSFGQIEKPVGDAINATADNVGMGLEGVEYASWADPATKGISKIPRVGPAIASRIPGVTSTLNRIPAIGKPLGGYAGLGMLPSYGAYVAMQAPVDAYNLSTGRTNLQEFDKGVQGTNYLSGAYQGAMNPGTAAASSINTGVENFNMPAPKVTGNATADSALHTAKNLMPIAAPGMLVPNTLTRNNPQSFKELVNTGERAVGAMTGGFLAPKGTDANTMHGPAAGYEELRRPRFSENPNYKPPAPAPRPAQPMPMVSAADRPLHEPGIAFDPVKGYVDPKPQFDAAESGRRLAESKRRQAAMEQMRQKVQEGKQTGMSDLFSQPSSVTGRSPLQHTADAIRYGKPHNNFSMPTEITYFQQDGPWKDPEIRKTLGGKPLGRPNADTTYTATGKGIAPNTGVGPAHYINDSSNRYYRDITRNREHNILYDRAKS